jgi:hypothetical protein
MLSSGNYTLERKCGSTDLLRNLGAANAGSAFFVAVEERFLGRVFSLIKQGENLAVVLAMVAAVLLQDFVATSLILLLAGLCLFRVHRGVIFQPGGRALLATQ